MASQVQLWCKKPCPYMRGVTGWLAAVMVLLTCLGDVAWLRFSILLQLLSCSPGAADPDTLVIILAALWPPWICSGQPYKNESEKSFAHAESSPPHRHQKAVSSS